MSPGSRTDGCALKAPVNQPLTAEPVYPWAAQQPRWSVQAALEAALAGTMTPADALKQAQKETADWLAQQTTAQ